MADGARILDKSGAKPALNVAQLMQKAKKDQKVGFVRQTREIVALQRGRPALTPYEYYYYGLFDPARAWEKKLEYVGDERSRAIFLLANKLTWWDVAEDKLLYQAFMEAQGYRLPKLHALAHPERQFNGVPNLRDAAAVRKWLCEAELPLFGKPVMSSHGIGGVLIESVDAASGTFTTDAGAAYPVDMLLAEIDEYIRGDGYIFQQALRPDPAIAHLTGGRVSTLRIIVLLGPDGPQLFEIICRLPCGENRVDNFRKAGNLIASVDADTGRLGPVTRGVSVNREVLDRHPDSGMAFADFAFPRAAEAAKMALDASTLFPKLHIQSWDIAICDDGIYAIEMNPGGNFNVAQLVRNEGALTPKFHEFVRWCATLNLNGNDKARKEAVRIVA